MSAWLHLRWMRDTPGNSLIAVRGKRGGWKRESWMTAARQGRRILSKEKDRERWRRLENGGKGRRRERKLFSAMLRALQKHTVSLSLSLSTPRSSSSFSTSIPSPPLLAISSPFRDVCNRFERLERPREPTRASAFSVYHRLPSIFTIFTSRPRDPTAYNQTSRTEEKGTWDPLPTFPSLDVPPRVIAAYFHYLRPRSRVERIFEHAWKSMDRLYKIYIYIYISILSRFVIIYGRRGRFIETCHRFQFQPIFFFL